MKTTLVTISDDRFGRKNGLYEKTQDYIAHIIKQNEHFGITSTMMLKWHDVEASDFYREYKTLLSNTDAARNGRAYKPWAIKKAFDTLAEGDFLIYTDCSPEMWKMHQGYTIPDQFRLSVLQDLCAANGGILSCFVKWDTRHIPQSKLGIHTHANFTLDRCMKRMGAYTFKDCFMHASGMMVFQKNEVSKSFLDEWIDWNCVDECASLGHAHIKDDYSFWEDEKMTKMGHRHDQSISGLLINLFGIKLVDMPTSMFRGDVLYDLNPHLFLNYCCKDTQYQFIDPNHNPETERRLRKGDTVINAAGEELLIFEFRPNDGTEWIIVGKHDQSCYATTAEHLRLKN